ncbi:NAD-dependent epimerase/dehydratase family protein [Pseudoduganella eburnea]|uniref:NAD-dependent epimerase/dehydratase family protein n=1 Tax=Massilia eburnea TaxID=1776165 RepID=A0A6L6QE29_9BURK|nr:NAD(P)-dependent oxidoreductase [Massilia eburnea]MTW10449.1 NAD-dependent epimerase/dehydratase family protein [Massilia eburnea]
MTAKPFKRILLTGAAGGLGKVLRDRIKAWSEVVRLSDIADMGEARSGEELVQCDLSDKAAVLKLMEGVDAVLHFGGISTEAPFEAIMQANILGVANLYEAAHKHGVKRLVFASSNHAIGYYRTTDMLDANMPTRPDSMYGISKVFGEQMSRYYYDRFGLETVCIRIGSSFPQPANKRMMSTYLSYDDLTELLRCSLFAPRVGHTIVFGMSDNDSVWWDNRYAAHLGYRPKDSSSKFAHLFPDSAEFPEKDDITTIYQGGKFLLDGPMFK